jgi:hypothetical protein
VFARTKRLTLRPGWPEDAPALTRAISHENVVAKLARAPWPYALGDAEAFLAQPRGGHEPRFLIETMEAGVPRLVGGIGIQVADSGHELGYWLTPEAWGRGYATEAGQAVVAMATCAGLAAVGRTSFRGQPGIWARAGEARVSADGADRAADFARTWWRGACRDVRAGS